MGKPKLIGVVTVTFNSSSVIRGFMDSLLQQTHREFMLYAVDNASSDDTLNAVSEYQDSRVVVIANRTNLGVAEGNNIGIRAALQDGCVGVLLINNDTEFGSDLLSRLLDGLDQYQCDMIVPKILYFDPPGTIWCAGGELTPFRGSARHFGLGRKDDGSFDQPRAITYSPTCCLLARREVFDRIGVMDAGYFAYFDDTDFCLRAHRVGIRMYYLPEARMVHKVSSLMGHRSELSLRFAARNHVYYVLKNFPVWMFVYYAPVCQAHLLVRSLSTRSKVRAFSIGQKGFWEGLSLALSSPPSTGWSFGAREPALEPTPRATYLGHREGRK